MKTLMRCCGIKCPGPIVLALALSTPFSAVQALAQVTLEQSVSVSWADLNLARPAGLNQLYLRLEQASRAVCAPREDSRNPPMRRDYENCQARAMDAAVSDIGNRALRNLHADRRGAAGLQKDGQVASR